MNLEFFELKLENTKDKEEVVKIINEAYRGELKGNAWTGEAHLLSGIRIDIDMLNEYLKEKNTKTFIAKNNNQVVATIQAKLEDNTIYIGLFAVDPNIQASGVGRRLLEFTELETSKIWKIKSFVMEVISSRTELRDYYIRRGYQNTNSYIEFPRSEKWSSNKQEELKLLVLKKEI
ncbi:GNAT family N-acetyltransferase [Aliarcobacter trophiarum LMG 25534]|uniref:Acetyltransferase n=1 Tax=Aliarcobacter trophiarum LMG 25534 TaxID=1032241 RepID=A0AAD0QK53_9BACT|nr:GNAT family N-acetyltransferase [Aliarcobacter trophiarum]AXK49408.1 acetyltransferase [Aliarcobacter trophiarum LMG 25534]RXJ91981.1 GNAT family N-acetyltransferase [Aliarcobacter trophiarum LMG 25534]